MPYSCRRLTIDDLDAMHSIVYNRVHLLSNTKFQNQPTLQVLHTSSTITMEYLNKKVYESYKIMLSNPEFYYVYGAFSDNNDLLCHVATQKWNYKDEWVWTQGGMQTTEKFELESTYESAVLPDCLIDSINMSVTGYEDLGIYKMFSLTHILPDSAPRPWIPIIDMPGFLTNNYEYVALEVVPGGAWSKNLAFNRYVLRETLSLIARKIYMRYKT